MKQADGELDYQFTSQLPQEGNRYYVNAVFTALASVEEFLEWTAYKIACTSKWEMQTTHVIFNSAHFSSRSRMAPLYLLPLEGFW